MIAVSIVEVFYYRKHYEMDSVIVNVGKREEYDQNAVAADFFVPASYYDEYEDAIEDVCENRNDNLEHISDDLKFINHGERRICLFIPRTLSDHLSDSRIYQPKIT